jgi:cell wall-associated NlpC family hydrolase
VRMSRSSARRGIIAAAAIALTGALFTIPSAQAAPDVTKKDVERAFHEAETINEQVNAIGVRVKQTQAEIDDISADIEHDLVAYNAQKDELSGAIVQQQMDAPLGPTANLLGSSNPEEFLDGLGAVQALNSTRADALAQFADSSTALKNRRAQLQDRRNELAAAKKDADDKRAKIQRKYQDAKAELARLDAADRASLNSSETKLDFNPSAAGRAKAAVAFALAQLGEPYVYGGAGPNSWDCSGLMMKAWAAAGVTIPRVVGPQMSAGKRIPLSQVQPGDLVAYGDMSHIGMVLGNGKVVHAPRPGKSVEITSMSGFSVAARVG